MFFWDTTQKLDLIDVKVPNLYDCHEHFHFHPSRPYWLLYATFLPQKASSSKVLLKACRR